MSQFHQSTKKAINNHNSWIIILINHLLLLFMTILNFNTTSYVLKSAD